MSYTTNTQILNAIYQRHNISYPNFQFNTQNHKFICWFKLPDNSIMYSYPMKSKKLAKESVAGLVLNSINDIIQRVTINYNKLPIPVFTGLVIVDGDNITKSDQIQLLSDMESENINILFVVMSTYDTSKIVNKFKKIIIIENAGKQSVDIWIIGYIIKYDFKYGPDIVLISNDKFASTLANMAHIFHNQLINIQSYNSASAFILAHSS